MARYAGFGVTAEQVVFEFFSKTISSLDRG